MSRIFVHGTGAISPAGWGSSRLMEAVVAQRRVVPSELIRPNCSKTLPVNRVPPPETRPAFLSHPRMRRASPISQFAVGAALEAVGPDKSHIAEGALRLGILFCAFTGSVNYSRRFYAEVLTNPAGASPLLFTETVFNAPASHLAAVLGSPAITYTLVGDQGEFIKALALAAQWLEEEQVDACLVVGAEEADWLTADALRMFSPDLVAAEGSAAVYLRREPSAIELRSVSDAHLYRRPSGRTEAASRLGESFGRGDGAGDLLCDGLAGTRDDDSEAKAWSDWNGHRISVRSLLGEGFAAMGGWQAVAAVESLRSGRATRGIVSVVGGNLQAIGAEFQFRA